MNIMDGRKSYEDMEIPKELHQRINDVIKNDKKHRAERKVIIMLKKTTLAAAAFLAIFTLGLNTSPAFAETAAELPVIGTLARVLTVRSYQTKEGDVNIDLKMPAIDSQARNGEAAFTDSVNAEIERLIDDYTAQAKTEFEEYKEAFFATGGTEEEWAGREMDVIIDYDVKYQKDPILSLELRTSKCWVAASEERHYYNLDLSRDKELSLSDLLGEDWMSVANSSIDRQIQERIAKDQSLSYYGYGDNELTAEKFSSINEETDFYINAEGNVVIVFPEYAIAPGYMGIQEFVINN